MPITQKSVTYQLQFIPKIAILIVLITFFLYTNGIHIHTQIEDQHPNAYNKNQYAKELSDIQIRFNNDL